MKWILKTDVMVIRESNWWVCILVLNRRSTWNALFSNANEENLIFSANLPFLRFYVSTYRGKDMICTVHTTSFPLIESEKLFEKSLIGKLSWNRHFFLMSIEYKQCCQLYFFQYAFFLIDWFFVFEKYLEVFMRMNTLHFAFARNPKTTMNGGKVGK